MASDEASYFRALSRRGYKIPKTTNGNGHVEIWFGGVLVATHSGSRPGGRGFSNLKSQVRRFEEGRETRKTRKTRKRDG